MPPDPDRFLVHADGGDCQGTPIINGRCPACGLCPDGQSLELWTLSCFDPKHVRYVALRIAMGHPSDCAAAWISGRASEHGRRRNP